MITAEIQQRITDWRRKAVDKTLTDDEMKQAIIVLRELRRSAAPEPGDKPKRGSTKRVVNEASLFDELAGL
jgi:hypothetical protein